MLGCGDGTRPATGTPAPTATPAIEPARTTGGILRLYNFDAQIQDTLDPHLTQLGPVVAMHSAVFSRVLRYEDERAGTLAPDLAERMPEQPDELSYIIRLRDNARFHDQAKSRLAYPNVAGRALTSADVRFSLERQINQNSPQARRMFRYAAWNAIDRIETPDDRTVIVRLKTPVAPFPALLAGRHAAIMPREVIDGRDEAAGDLAMIGSGPFMLDTWQPGTVVKLRRNPGWFARNDSPGGIGRGRPFMDGYDAFYSPQEDAFQRAAFERKLVDATEFTDPGVLDYTRTTLLRDIIVEERDAGGVLASRLLLDRPPFNDDRVRRAVHLAVDRRALAELLYPDMAGKPSAKLSGPIAPAMPFALHEDTLGDRPGYRVARESDIAEARQLWSAAVGDAQLEVTVIFAGVPRILPERAAPLLERQLRETLGLRIVPQVDASGNAIIGSALGRNLDGATEGVAQFTFMLEDGGVDQDEWLYAHFRSGQSMNTYRLQDSALDSQLERARREFDSDERARIGRDVQDYLLAKVNARIEYLAPVQRRLSWGYVRNPHQPLWYGSSDRLADTWLDHEHAAWLERPA